MNPWGHIIILYRYEAVGAYWYHIGIGSRLLDGGCVSDDLKSTLLAKQQPRANIVLILMTCMYGKILTSSEMVE